MSGNLTVSGLANWVGVSPDAMRYYERLGLLPPPARSPAGYRSYDQRAVARLRFVKGAQRVGLRLREIAELLQVVDRGQCPAATPRDCCASGWRKSTSSLPVSRRCGTSWSGCSPRPQGGLHGGDGPRLVVRTGVCAGGR